jgi:DegV family protein with EDD domain
MADYILSCCSTTDLNEEVLEGIDVKYLSFTYELDGVSYKDDFGRTIPLDKFYKAMEDGADTRTSQISVSDYLDFFTKCMEQGYDVLHVCLSSGISGTSNSATNAANIASERYPDRKIYVVDSLAASSGYGLLMQCAAAKRDEGMSIDELHRWIEENKLYVHHWFFSTDLKFYIKGGRVSKTSGTIATVLGICPLLHVDVKGRLIPMAKVRTKKKVIRETVARMEKYALNGYDYDGPCNISNSACLEDAEAVRDLVEEKFPKLKGKVRIYSIGTTIGSHTGPGTVALFFLGEKRED